MHFVHGSFSGIDDAFGEQIALEDAFEIVRLHRYGFGPSPVLGRSNFENDARGLLALLEEPGHVVGHSYGAVVSLVAASLRPEAFKSLTVIEPPAFGLVATHPNAVRLAGRLRPVFAGSAQCAPSEFLGGFLRGLGYPIPPDFALDPEEASAVRSTVEERWPGEAPIDLSRIAAAGVPAMVACGAWDNVPDETRDLAYPFFRAVCDRVASELNAELHEFPGASHNPQRLGGPFNEVLRAFLARISD